MNGELKSMWKDAVMTYLKELSQEVPVGTKASVKGVVLMPRTESSTYRSNEITHKVLY
jgi:hypothetical protein